MRRNYSIGAVTIVAILVLFRGHMGVEAAGEQAPRFEVDPLWPKPLPNHRVVGAVIGVSVDGNDHIRIIHRQGSLEAKEQYATMTPKSAECCAAAPPVLEFDEAGNLIGHWGGPGAGYDWPSSNHGITVDVKGNVWIGGNGRTPAAGALASDESSMGAAGAVNDSFLLKFTQDGKFLQDVLRLKVA